MNGLQFISEYKNEIMNLATENGMRNVRLFGSVARGDDHIDSDSSPMR